MKRSSVASSDNPVAKKFQHQARNRLDRKNTLPSASDLPAVISFLERTMHLPLKTPEQRRDIYDQYNVNNVIDLYAKVRAELEASGRYS